MEEDTKLCYKLCIPKTCVNDSGKVCVINKAKVRNGDCFSKDCKCENIFVNSSTTCNRIHVKKRVLPKSAPVIQTAIKARNPYNDKVATRPIVQIGKPAVRQAVRIIRK